MKYIKFNKKCGVYIIKNTINEKVYIGSSKNILKRIQKHFFHLKKGNHHSPPLQNHFNKYGNCIYFELLEECKPEELTIREQHWMNSLKPKFNVAKDANCSFIGRNVSEKEREQVGARFRGKKLPEEMKERIKVTLSKTVLEYNLEGELIKEWLNPKEAAAFYGYNYSFVAQVARGESKQHHTRGKFFIYKDLYSDKELKRRIELSKTAKIEKYAKRKSRKWSS